LRAGDLLDTSDLDIHLPKSASSKPAITIEDIEMRLIDWNLLKVLSRLVGVLESAICAWNRFFRRFVLFHNQVSRSYETHDNNKKKEINIK